MGLLASLFPFSASSFPWHRPGLVLGDPCAGTSHRASRVVMSHCSWPGNGSNIAPAPRQAGGHTAAPDLCPAPSTPSPRLPTFPAPHKHHSQPISFTQHPMAMTPASCKSWPWDHELPDVLQSFPPPPPQPGDGCGGSLPSLPFSFSPGHQALLRGSPGQGTGRISHVPTLPAAGFWLTPPFPQPRRQTKPNHTKAHQPRRPAPRVAKPPCSPKASPASTWSL